MTETLEQKVSHIASGKGEISSLSSRIVNSSAVVDRLPLGIMACALNDSLDIEVLFLNPFAQMILELDENTALPISISAVLHQDTESELHSQIQKIFHSKSEFHLEWSMGTGSIERYISSQLIPLLDHNGEVYQVLCTIEDQTAEKLAERNLLHHAFHDTLTGLPNRVLFRSKLEEAVADCQKNGTTGCAVMIINIDRFQQINESFGHSAGDRFLVSMSATLRRCLRSSDTLARLSGDEFAILVSSCRDLEEVEMIAERIHQAMKLPYDLDSNEVFTSVSVGVASSLTSSTHPEDLIRDADFAMHSAKTAGKSCTEFYKRDTHQRARSQFHLETELRRAVERGELELHYQPIIDLDNHELHGFEALTRWIHKDRGFVSPAEFIPLAEETGIIVPLGRWAINTAAEQIAKWRTEADNGVGYPINVNVSGIQFARDDVAAMTEEAMRLSGIPGDLLRIELTESAIMSNPASIAETLTKIKKQGVKIALDDFGTGYSSLNYLHQFPIDIIKIDRSFINQLKAGNELYKILDMISMLASNLGHELVAEGLEDIEHIEMLRDLNFHYGQGFYYSKPVSTDIADKFIKGELPWDK